MTEPPAAVTRVAADLAGLGAVHAPRPTPAADTLPGGELMAHTAVFEADGNPVLVVSAGVPDPVDLAGVLGAMTVRAVPDAVTALWTGQSPQAVAPVGHASALPTVIDVNLAAYRALWVPAGAPGHSFATTYSELLRITAGTAAEVGKLPDPGTAPTAQS